MAVHPNPLNRPDFTAPAVSGDARRFHEALDGYAPTPLRTLDALAAQLGVAEVWVKDEAQRLGLPAFKILGASWATYRLLEQRRGRAFDTWSSLDDLRVQVAALGAITLAAPTDGNHGRAVARMATILGLASRIRVPTGTVTARIDAIASEGAEVSVSDGGYDDAVAEVAAWADDTTLVVSDTSWEGYDDVPQWIIGGYSTIFSEIGEQLADAGAQPPTAVVIPTGVGAFLAAAVTACREAGAPHPVVAAVEPVNAACVTASALAGRVITLPGEQHSIMAGLTCGTPSIAAWPTVSAGTDVFVTVTDDEARAAMRTLAAVDVVAGESGAASHAGAVQLASAGHIGPDDRVLLVSTEGVTDPAAYEEIVGHRG